MLIKQNIVYTEHNYVDIRGVFKQEIHGLLTSVCFWVTVLARQLLSSFFPLNQEKANTKKKCYMEMLYENADYR